MDGLYNTNNEDCSLRRLMLRHLTLRYITSNLENTENTEALQSLYTDILKINCQNKLWKGH